MTSYISTQSISSAMCQSILRMQTELAACEAEVSTGNYADIGQTLGAQTGENVSLQAQKSLLQTITDTNQTVATRLSTTETILGNLWTNARIFSTPFSKTMAQPQMQAPSKRLGKATYRT